TTVKRTFRRDALDIRFKGEKDHNESPQVAADETGEGNSKEEEPQNEPSKFHRPSTEDAHDPGHVKYKFCILEPDDDVDETNNPEPEAYTKPLHYKKWHAAALEVLEHRIYVVVAGVHIQEVPNAVTVNAVKCPTAGSANV